MRATRTFPRNCLDLELAMPQIDKQSVNDGTEYVETVNEKGETVVKQKIDPVTVMLTTLQNERYDRVVG